MRSISHEAANRESVPFRGTLPFCVICFRRVWADHEEYPERTVQIRRVRVLFLRLYRLYRRLVNVFFPLVTIVRQTFFRRWSGSAR